MDLVLDHGSYLDDGESVPYERSDLSQLYRLDVAIIHGESRDHGCYALMVVRKGILFEYESLLVHHCYGALPFSNVDSHVSCHLPFSPPGWQEGCTHSFGRYGPVL